MKEDNMTPTFYRLFPEAKNNADRALRFLRHYYENRASKRASSKDLGIDIKTYSRIYDDVLNNYAHVTERLFDEFEESAATFISPSFAPTVHKRLEKEMQELRTRIRDMEHLNNHNMAIRYRAQYQNLLNAELQALSKFILAMKNKPWDEPQPPRDAKPEDTRTEVEKMADEAYDEKRRQH